MRASHKNTTLTAVVVLILCVGAVVVWRAKATTVVPAGYDEFATPPNATSFEYWSLPGGFSECECLAFEPGVGHVDPQAGTRYLASQLTRGIERQAM
jgi:hypothetical protein